tara:strand:- start:194 stop:313 length:120 start_codon:yes stop_codon:yes gene_type:complete
MYLQLLELALVYVEFLQVVVAEAEVVLVDVVVLVEAVKV